jgi:hypothetical protein
MSWIAHLGGGGGGGISFTSMEKSTTAEREHFSGLNKEKSFLGSAKKVPQSAMYFSMIRKEKFQRIPISYCVA